MNRAHERIEAIAGAIALGEATDDQRSEYRAHLTECAACLRELGGEHEIERTAKLVADARADETWQPHVGDVVASRAQRRARTWQYGTAIAAFSLAVSLGVHAMFASVISPLGVQEHAPTVFDVGTTRIVLEQRSQNAPSQQAQAPAPQRQLVVMHNVVSMQRAALSVPPVPIPRAKVAEPPAQVAITVHPPVAAHRRAHSDRPVWDDPQPPQSWHTVATTTTTSQLETAPQTLTHSAESMQFGPVHRDREANLAGGETAINPQPPMIAYDEGAQGTSVFEVLIDERGTPTKCVITKSSGYLSLDGAVCKAAMAAKYLPKIQDGRAVAGVYRDAFTFRMQDDQSIEGIPRNVPHAGQTPQTPVTP